MVCDVRLFSEFLCIGPMLEANCESVPENQLKTECRLFDALKCYFLC